MAEELKNRSIRADEDTFTKFKQIASENFTNQNQCLNELIKIYELDQGKQLMPDRKAEIENFEMHIDQLQNMFLHSLQMNYDAEARVKMNFKTELEEKDRKLQAEVEKSTSYFEELNSAKAQIEDKDSQIKELEAEKSILTSDVDKYKNQINYDRQKLETEIDGKNDFIKTLNNTIKEKDLKIEELNQKIEDNKEKISKIDQLENANKTLESEKEDLNKQITALEEKHKNDLTAKDLDIKQAELKIKEELNDKVERYRQRNNDLRDKIRELENKLDKLDKKEDTKNTQDK